MARELAIELARDHAVEVWTSSGSAIGEPPKALVEGITVRRFAFSLPPARPLPVLRFPANARRTYNHLTSAYREFRPQLLHVICFGANGAYATELARKKGIPLVISLAGETFMDDHDIYDRSLLLRASLRRGIREATAVTACSRFTLCDAQRFGLRGKKGSVIYNGTTLDEITPEYIETPFDRYVLCLGRLVVKKGFDLMIEAFAQVARTQSDVGLIIAGRGEMLPALQALAAKFGLSDRVQFTGSLGRASVAGAIQRASVLIMPSRVEPFGIVALEGWRGRTPIVVTSHGGTNEFVRSEIDGLVVDPYDTAALAKAVLRVLNDDSLAASLVAAGSDRVQQFTWEKIAAEYVQTYDVALRARSEGIDPREEIPPDIPR